MDLLDSFIDPSENLLPLQGAVYYYGAVLNAAHADAAFESLLDGISWAPDEAIIRGKRIQTRRAVAWYGDSQYDYNYSNITRRALPWTEELLQLRQLIEEHTSESFNSCLANLYHNGSEGVAWHSDDEADLKRHGAIASVSLGAERKFRFRHTKTAQTLDLMLQHGSLLVMSGVTQSYWKHCLPPMRRVQNARINLTFRTIEA